MSHNHKNNENDAGIRFGLALNTAYTIAEFCFGTLTGSLALIADASHNLTDTATLAVSFVANRVARRDADESKTFGYGRTTILAALFNASVMLVVAGFIVVEAVQRLTHPQPVEGGVVAIVAAFGIAVNGSIAYVLSKRHGDLNMRSAFIDMAFDALSSLGAVIAGLIIMLTGINGIDSIVGLIIAGLLTYNTLKIFTDAVHILLEGTPKDINMAAITQAIKGVPDVNDVDDLHIWSIRSGYNALSCHIIIDKNKLPKSRDIVEAIKAKLLNDCNIQHSAIEVELHGCDTNKEHKNR